MRLNDFYDLLRSQVQEICSELGLKPELETDRGTGFEHWCAQFLIDARGPFDMDGEEAAHGRSGDLKADIILPDANRRQLIICQTKFISQRRNADEDEVSSFFGRHKTGRPALAIGRHAYGIPGMDPDDSERLLQELVDFACQAPRIYQHAWTPGDAVLWDNRRLLHQARPWDMREPRVMYHARIAGDPSTEFAAPA